MRKFWRDCLLATIFVFMAMWVILKITQLNIFNAFDSIGTALSDVELTDYVFSGLRDDPNVDEDIVVVNIGNLTRREIAEELRIISKYKPRVIGIDGFFDCRTGLRDTLNCPQLKDTLGNMMLSSAIQDAGNVVLVTKALQSSKIVKQGIEIYDSIRRSDPMFRDHAIAEGYASLETNAAFQDDVKTCRTFNPTLNISNVESYAFGVELARAVDSVKTRKFLERRNYSEVINYRGNVVDFFHQTKYPQMFYTLDVADVFSENFVAEAITGKIVVFGFLGEYIGDPSWADKFYTPLNKKLAGKANPDMFGVVVHANIVSMILHEDYVNEMEDWQEYIMAFIFCLLNVALFSLINKHLPSWYDGITKLLQLTQLLLYSVLMVLIFHWYSFKLNITITLAAVALVGDVFEIYTSIIKNAIFRLKMKFHSLTRRDDEVYIPGESQKD
ncbi:CHASE2 domain-containing protein [Chryseolinea lacunae]|uniref:CHASE2 domain-containing protein n=1 Tax=Chryseolinea lacunae TaxID=2801331 RepID=A0ABS1KSF7_9BACT|nr:CHASE2 domain-containing protein [Chryseolinea lacunae]MBL0742361.1 CHASE2 domain-containing protein [Chryseolinea lacunae]